MSVAFLVVHMWRAGRTMKRSIEGRLGESAARTGLAAAAGVFLFTVLMVSREGMETQSTGQMDDAAIRDLWLKRVQTRPADFLRARFLYQLQADQLQEKKP